MDFRRAPLNKNLPVSLRRSEDLDMKMGVLLVWLFPAILVAAAFGMPGCNEGSESSVSVMDRKIFGSKGPVFPAMGPHKIHPPNSRYFTDGSARQSISPGPTTGTISKTVVRSGNP
jgi:hypothetical protein